MQRNRLAVNFYFGVNGFIYANWVSRLPRLQEIYEIDNGTTGIVLLVLALGALAAMPFAGWLIVKNGSQKITVLSAILFCVFVPFMAVAGNITFLIPLFFITGFSTGLMDVGMNAQAVLVEEKYQKPIMSSFHAVFSLGAALGAGSGALFTKLGTPLFIHLSIISTLGLVFAIWSNFNLVKDGKTEQTEEESQAFVLPSKALWGIGIIAFCCMLGEAAMMDWGTNYMKNIALSSAVLAPIGLVAFNIAMVLGRLFGDQGRIYFGDDTLMIINSLIAFVGIFLVIVFPIPSIVILGLFLIGLGLSVIVPIAYSTAGSAKGLAPGVGISMVTTIGYSGFVFGPPIIGFLADWQDLRIAMIFVAFLFLVMTLLTVWNRRKLG